MPSVEVDAVCGLGGVGQGSVVCIMAAFTLEASPFLYWEPLLAIRSFEACELSRFPLAPQAPQFMSPEVVSVQA